MTPNLLARTVQSIEVGGVICILLETVSFLKQLYTSNMVRIFTDNSAISCRLLLLHLLKVIMKKFVIWNLRKICTQKWNFPWRINSLVNVTKCAKAGWAKWLSVRSKTSGSGFESSCSHLRICLYLLKKTLFFVEWAKIRFGWAN